MKCEVCEHPRRRQIDVRLAADDSILRVGAFYDLNTRSLEEHRKNHLTEMAPVLLARPHTLLADLEWIDDECRTAIALVKQAEKPNMQVLVALLGEFRRNKETQVKLAKELHLTWGGGVPAEWKELQERVMAALEPYPEAAEAVLKAVEEK